MKTELEYATSLNTHRAPYPPGPCRGCWGNRGLNIDDCQLKIGGYGAASVDVDEHGGC